MDGVQEPGFPSWVLVYISFSELRKWTEFNTSYCYYSNSNVFERVVQLQEMNQHRLAKQIAEFGGSVV